MCNHYSVIAKQATVDKTSQALKIKRKVSSSQLPSYHHVSGFDHPSIPVIRKGRNGEVGFDVMSWGLIPHWCKQVNQALDIRSKTLNARAETLLEKPSFREAVVRYPCLILASGFYEFQHRGKQKVPYYIHSKKEDFFFFAGVYDRWKDPESEVVSSSCSIITTEANALMQEIHNTKKRMPAILDVDRAGSWLERDFLAEDRLLDTARRIQPLLTPYDSDLMDAFTIGKLLVTRGAKTNVPEVKTPFTYL